jgi:4-amino-4-deoxy-L-arabinose transferase-like glycosyltransferase
VASNLSIPRWLVAAALLITLAGLGFHDLWTPDEPREAALALAMSRGGDGIIPHLAGEPFVEKPPLYYDLAAAWLRVSPFSAPSAGWLRLISAFYALGTLAMLWLLARRLLGRAAAPLAVLVLATLPGFVHVSHWLLTDGALMFFVTAALAALAGAYLGGRPALLPVAGALAAAAFLTKGIIGPIFIAFGGLPLLLLAAPWKRPIAALPNHGDSDGGREAGDETPGPRITGVPPCTIRPSPSAMLLYHLAALITFALPVAAWADAFWRSGGRALFMEWFWTNHFGRFSGAATQLGHINGPLFYLGALPLYLLPWLPPIAWLLWRAVRQRALWRELAMPLAWGLGGALLLSLSATKREIYLAPLLPAFALLAAQGLQRLELRPQTLVRYAGVLVGLYLLALTIGEPLVDRYKSYGGAFREFDQKLAVRSDLRAAAWAFDETTSAGFEWYVGRIFPVLTNSADASAVLAGHHPHFNALIVCHKRGEHLPPDFAAAQETQVPMGARRTLLLLHRNPSGVPSP